MIKQLLNEKTWAELEGISHDFTHAKPFKHVVIDDFFELGFCQKMLDNFQGLKTKMPLMKTRPWVKKPWCKPLHKSVRLINN